jgi:hypothetical protein
LSATRAYRDLPQDSTPRLMVVSLDSIPVEETNFEASIFRAPPALRANRVALIESADGEQKKICWMKKIW